MKIRREDFEYLNLYAHFLFDENKNICAIILNGSMDTQGILKLQKWIKEMLPIRKYDLVLDLTHVMYISSSGLGFLIYLQEYKKELCLLSHPPDSILKTFRLLNLESMFTYYESVDELKNLLKASEDIIVSMRQELSAIRDTQYTMHWVKILRDYLAHEEMVKQMELMSPYILQADHSESITIPSEEKYACILFKFIEKVFRKEAGIANEEIDDVTLELIAKELMTNAVMHGYDSNKEGVVEANFNINGEKFEIDVIDYGKGYDESSRKDDVLPSAGLKLIKEIFDTVKIENAPKKKVPGLVRGKGTKVTMVKALAKK
jgi:stage II sporulation protein AB (anti-sigma F factor)